MRVDERMGRFEGAVLVTVLALVLIAWVLSRG